MSNQASVKHRTAKDYLVSLGWTRARDGRWFSSDRGLSMRDAIEVQRRSEWIEEMKERFMSSEDCHTGESSRRDER